MDYKQLYEQAQAKLTEAQAELTDFKETSKLIESELEAQLEAASKRLCDLERENEKLKQDFALLKRKFDKEIKLLEHNLENERSERSAAQQAKDQAEKKTIELENDNERLQCQTRESGLIISDLENKINETFEQLALVQTQLELNQNESQVQIERLKQHLKETEDELRIYQLSPTRSPDKSNSVISSPLKPLSPLATTKPYSHTVFCQNKDPITPSQSQPYFSLQASKPSSFMVNIENARKKANHVELKERYKLLKRNPEFRLTCDDIKETITHTPALSALEKTDKQEKLKSKQHLEEKLKNFSSNLSQLKSNNDGFHKSLDLVNGLIKGLDKKIQKIREMKEVSPNNGVSHNITPVIEEDVVL